MIIIVITITIIIIIIIIINNNKAEGVIKGCLGQLKINNWRKNYYNRWTIRKM